MPASKRGTGFIGLQQYLGLNQGAAQRMAEGLTGEVEDAMGAFKGNVDTGVGKFGEQVSAGSAMGPTEDMLPGQLKALSQRKYTGPQGLGEVADMGALEAEKARVGNMVGALGTNSGRAALLAQKYPGQGYGWGSQALDAALVGAGGGATLNQARGGWERLKGYLGKATTGAAEQVEAAKAGTEAAATKAGQQYEAWKQGAKRDLKDDVRGNRPDYKPRPGGNKYGGGY